MLDTEPSPAYQRIALEARQLQELGLNFSRIAEHLGVDLKDIATGPLKLQLATTMFLMITSDLSYIFL